MFIAALFMIVKDPDAGKDWGQEEKGTTEDEMVEWCHRLNGHEFEQAPGDGDGQGSLVCYSPWRHQESDTSERLNWTDEFKWLMKQRWTYENQLYFHVLVTNSGK